MEATKWVIGQRAQMLNRNHRWEGAVGTVIRVTYSHPYGVLLDVRGDHDEPGQLPAHDYESYFAPYEAGDELCSDCGERPADLPSRLCCGCEAYREHQWT